MSTDNRTGKDEEPPSNRSAKSRQMEREKHSEEVGSTQTHDGENRQERFEDGGKAGADRNRKPKDDGQAPEQEPTEYVKENHEEENKSQRNDSEELSFVADISYKYGQEAAARGVKLVSFCGIDSLPSDLAVALIQREALRRRKMPCHEIKTAVTDCFGGFSGSAVVGLGQLFEEGAVFDPFFLVKYAAASPPSHVDFAAFTQPQIFLAKYDEDFGYCAYNVMAPINENVVRFSTVLQGIYPQDPSLAACGFPSSQSFGKSEQTSLPSVFPPSSSSGRLSSTVAEEKNKASDSFSSPDQEAEHEQKHERASSSDLGKSKTDAMSLANSPASIDETDSQLECSVCWPYPSFLHYSECVALSYDIISASVVSLVTFILMFLATFSFTRAALTALRFFPKPGEGPPRQFLDNGHFEIKAIGRVRPVALLPSPESGGEDLEEEEITEMEDDDEEGIERRRYNRPHHQHKETVITVTIGSSFGDPGYKQTGKMLVETGLALALQLHACTNLCGVCTPASGVGVILRDRLTKAGMTIEMKTKQF
ncbi:putative saccharopine dehydrogenase [Toxoplasma gondii RUB]|uniref:Putative saccharopine dehydrogenase n=1 Tax=Toxoplasma gondii RUB TaxID=935652 RepID=A0A086MBR8_TOXGO|nr:putative saccharopine dehydrogenase [Toxoplasma gondii RUB]